MTTSAAFLDACLWELNRQHAAAAAAIHGPKAPRTPQLAKLRHAYLRAYAAIASKLPSGRLERSDTSQNSPSQENSHA